MEPSALAPASTPPHLCAHAHAVEAPAAHARTPHTARDSDAACYGAPVPHTVRTQLAERGAKLHTIMQVLGQSCASISMVYARISDREVLRDYQLVLGPGAVLAGPSARELSLGCSVAEAVDWLKTNFFKTELELGHCLRPSAGGTLRVRSLSELCEVQCIDLIPLGCVSAR